MWGNNDEGLTGTTNADIATTLEERLTRVWKVQETGTVGNVDIVMDVFKTPIYSTNASELYLLVSSS